MYSLVRACVVRASVKMCVWFKITCPVLSCVCWVECVCRLTQSDIVYRHTPLKKRRDVEYIYIYIYTLKKRRGGGGSAFAACLWFSLRFFFRLMLGWGETSRLIMWPQMDQMCHQLLTDDMEHWWAVSWRAKTKILGQKPVTVSLRPPQIQYRLP
jgi:hypothetical protein